MHISKMYITPVNSGDLSLPPLDQQAGTPKDSKLSDKINQSGAYIHKLCVHGDAVKEQFDKIESHTIPTPGTFVGVGIHRTYNMDRWAKTSGLIFSPDTMSMLSYKGDIASVRLSKNHRNISHFSSKSGKNEYEKYAQYLSTKFNALGETGTAFNNRKPKQLRLVEDVDFAKNKYRELELRSNLAFSYETPSPNEMSIFPDESSKFSIVKLLESSGITIDTVTKSSLLDFLTPISQEDTDLGQRLRHAIKKIERFDDDAAIQVYLDRGKEVPGKKNHYIAIMREWGAQTPNEHLLMPTIANIAGVCVNVEATDGIDQALKINMMLNERQKLAGIISNNNPAFVYHLSPKTGKSLVHIGWSQGVSPWSSQGLIEFAKTGLITGVDGNTFKPDHFKLIHTLADTSALVFFENEKALLNCKFTKNFVDDLSLVKENSENLLHIAITNNRDEGTIKFFYYWQVNAFSEKKSDNLTALELAEKTNHPGYPFLKKAEGWGNSKEIISLNRNIYISDRLDKIPRKKATYSLRNGCQEQGEISYIPEQGTYRVTKGSGDISKAKTTTWNGIQKYYPAIFDLACSIGTINCEKSQTIDRGIFSSIPNDGIPYIFHQYRSAAQPTPNSPVKSEGLSFISGLPDASSIYEIELKQESRRFMEAEIKGSRKVLITEKLLDPDPESCTYFETKLFLPKRLKKHIDSMSGEEIFIHLPISNKSFDRSIPNNDRRLIYAKYALVNIHYLSAWKKAIEELNPVETQFLEDKNSDFINETNSFLEKQKTMLHESMTHHFQNFPVQEVEKVDVYGRCLLQEFSDEYLNYSHADHANMQYILANRMELRNAFTLDDLVIARKLFEKAAYHSHGESEFALARYHQKGLGGLSVNKATARVLIDRAADHNVSEAIAARLLLTGNRVRLINPFTKFVRPKK